MNKYRKYYLIIWVILFVAFNAAVFLAPNTATINGITYDKFEGSFWPGYIGITVAFIGNLVCSLMFFSRSDSKEKAFLNMPILTISRTALIVTAIVGAATMLIPGCPEWLGALLCIAVLVFYVIAIVKATAASEAVSDLGAKVKQQISAMKLMTADAEILLSKAQNDEIMAEVKKVYEALRFSDPMSEDAIAAIENRISAKLGDFSESVIAGNTEKAKALSAELQELISDRAEKCKVIK